MNAPAPKTMLDHALKYARAGLHVFPCAPGSKKPLRGSTGLTQATRDEDTIRAWWAENPEANFGCVPGLSGHYVVDLDQKNGKDGAASLAALEAKNGKLPPTREVTTPTGGKHLWFRGKAPSSAERVGLGIDVRGDKGYVLLPPSKTAVGTYQLSGKRPFAGGAEWLTTLAQAPVVEEWERSPVTGEPITRACLVNMLRCIDPNAVRDEWRATVAALRATNCPDDDTRELAIRWSRGELHGAEPKRYTCDEEVEVVYDTMPPKAGGVSAGTLIHQARAGGYTGATDKTAAEKFAHVEKEVAGEDRHADDRFKVYRLSDYQTRPPIEWLIPGYFPKKGSVVVFGQWSSFKTFTLVSELLGLAQRGYRVLYLIGEGQDDFGQKRIPGWLREHGVTEKEWREIEDRFLIIEAVPRLQGDDTDKVFTEVKAAAPGFRPDVVVVDTITRATAGLNVNDSAVATAMTAGLERFERYWQCLAIGVGHTGKDVEKGLTGSNLAAANLDGVIGVEGHGADSSDPAASRAAAWRTYKPPRSGMAPDPLYFEADGVRQGTLVFKRTTAARFSEIAGAPEGGHPYTGENIKPALEGMGEKGRFYRDEDGAEQGGVTIPALATQLKETCTAFENESLKTIERNLRTAANPDARDRRSFKGRLRGFARRDGKGWLYGLPA